MRCTRARMFRPKSSVLRAEMSEEMASFRSAKR